MQPENTGTQRMRMLETLVSQMQAGDEQAFAHLFGETRPVVEKAVRRALYRYAPGHALPVALSH